MKKRKYYTNNNILYIGVSKKEMIDSIRYGRLKHKSIVPIYYRNRVVNYLQAYANSDKYDKFLYNLLGWNPRDGCVNLIELFDVAIRNGKYVLAVIALNSIQVFGTYCVTELPDDCIVINVYDVRDRKFYTLQEARKKFLRRIRRDI